MFLRETHPYPSMLEEKEEEEGLFKARKMEEEKEEEEEEGLFKASAEECAHARGSA
jgi:hypothetical protein